MPHTITTTVYRFEELSDKAKERAREWMREGTCQDSSWYKFTIEDAETIGGILGIEYDYRTYATMGGGTGREPRIYFCGFGSQGDGACFEGQYRYAKGAAKNIRQHAPQDAKLHRIADALQALQRPHLFRLTARVKHAGYYYHEHSTQIDVYDGDNEADAATADALADILRDFMYWIYKQLEAEYDYQISDEAIDEAITANEYDFDADGRRA